MKQMIEEMEEKGIKEVEVLGSVEVREYEARAVEIYAEQMSANISGRKNPVIGKHLHSENNKNQNPLEIKITEGDVFQPVGKPEVLVVPEGTISISGQKEFKDLSRFQKKEGELPQLPIRDPDLTEIDGRTFRQTGTIQVKVVKARITLRN